MKYSMKEMVDYGYTSCTVIPINYHEAQCNFFVYNKPVLVLNSDDTEYYARTEDDFKHKDDVMYGLERTSTEIGLITTAFHAMEGLIEELYYDANGNKNPNRPNDLMTCGMIDAEFRTWLQVLQIIGFTKEDVKCFIDWNGRI